MELVSRLTLTSRPPACWTAAITGCCERWVASAGAAAISTAAKAALATRALAVVAAWGVECIVVFIGVSRRPVNRLLIGLSAWFISVRAEGLTPGIGPSLPHRRQTTSAAAED